MPINNGQYCCNRRCELVRTHPVYLVIYFACLFSISISGKSSFLATDRVAVWKGIRLLTTIASNEM